ncbi:hypothetical protein CJU90_1158 [Yarrowia sp. C11]|nr:hypothetical protein CKK34_2572 [Yarrowia sp. E02]KAG5373456.1 hypothetical protein CJU90_1158 [Yarrowia sp. C11]
MTQSQEDFAVTQRVLVNDALYKRIAKTVASMAVLNEADPELKQQLDSDLRAYRLMLTKLKLQKSMNTQEVEKLTAQAGEASQETEQLQQTTAELEAQLEEARRIQQQKKQYTDLTSEFLRPYKVEVTLTREKEPSAVKEEDNNDMKEEDEGETVPTPSVVSRSQTPQTEGSPRRHGDDDEQADIDEDEDVEMRDEEADNSMDIDDRDEAIMVPEYETYNEVISAHLFRTRAEAAQLNQELEQDIADLKVTNNQYEATWQQRRHRFLEIIASLHTFQGDIQTEKAEQERRAAEREEEEKKRQEEEEEEEDDEGNGDADE